MITLQSTWRDFKTPEQWREWLDIAKQQAPDAADWWDTDECCNDCRHFDRANVWCYLANAPASRNPVLNMLGMACCGAGYEKTPKQLLLWA